MQEGINVLQMVDLGFVKSEPDIYRDKLMLSKAATHPMTSAM